MKGSRLGDLQMISNSDFASNNSLSELIVLCLLELKWLDGIFLEIWEEDDSAAASLLRVVRGEDF